MTLRNNHSASVELASAYEGIYGEDMNWDHGLPLADNRSVRWSPDARHPELLSGDTRWPSPDTGGLAGLVDTVTAVTVRFTSLDLYNVSEVDNGTTGPASDTTAAELVRDITLGVVLALLCLATMFGNAMVLHAVRTDRRLQTVSKT